MSLKYREVAEILKLIDASDCQELILETDGVRLVVRREGAAKVDELSGLKVDAKPLPQGARVQPDTKSLKSGSQGENKTVAEKRSDGRIEIRAPMVGSFYRSPSPTEPVFVEVGDRISQGQPLCLIEVMKLFTTIEATLSGVVREILVEDTALVDYGQPLFVIEPDVDEQAVK